MNHLRICWAISVLLLLGTLPGAAAVFTVTNNLATGPGSLAQAIDNANSNPGADQISFNIQPGGPQTITVEFLPNITDPVTIDATTQPGYSGSPIIEVTGSNSMSSAFLCIGGGNTIRGFVINNVNWGFYLYNGSSSNRIEGNWIGLEPNGSGLKGVAQAILVEYGSDNVIGGTTPAARNVIAGSTNGAINIYNGKRNIIQGNYLGTDATGMLERGNGYGGVNTPGGVYIDGGGTNQIGGTASGAGNLISGNNLGVVLAAHSLGNVVQGNVMGLNAAGTAPPVGRRQRAGVMVLTSHANLIGGTNAGAGNVLSGHVFGTLEGYGIQMYNGDFNLIQGNRIGTDVSGTLAVPNQAHGVFLYGVSRTNTVGGTLPGARNVISGNGMNGLFLRDAYWNSIQGNYIGTAADGVSPLGNGENGIFLFSGEGNTIGGGGVAAANVIACNGTNTSAYYRNGITLTQSDQFTSSSRTSMRRNSFFGNAGRGILLVDPTCFSASFCSPHNDFNDNDYGPNDLQNTPVLTNAFTSAGTLTVAGRFSGKANSAFTLDFYASPTASPSGFGEGKIYLGNLGVTTDSSGNADFEHYFADTGYSGQFISATATDGSRNTSEFAAVVVADGPAGALQFAQATASGNEAVGSVSVNVIRLGGTNGAVSVNFATANGTAVAGSDYTATSGTLNFASGESLKTIVVPLLNDSINEADETFSITLSSPTGGAVLASTATVTVTVVDDDPIYIYAGDTGATKPASGSTTMYFPVYLSQVAPRTIRVNYTTGDLTAEAGIDYQAASGQLEFTPGVTNQLVPVTILADGLQEGSKSLTLTLSNPTNVVLGDPQGLGTIYDGTQGVLQFTAASYVAPESAGQVTVTVSRVGGSLGSVSVPFSAIGGSASAGTDFVATNGVLNFASGQNSRSFTVPLIEDSDIESDETISLQLGKPSGTSLGSPAMALLTIQDNDLPQLAIQPVPGGVALYWPTQAASFQLESAPVLSAPEWGSVTNLPVPVGSQYRVIDNPGSNQRFYRLRR